VANSNALTPQHPLYLFLLAYRWASLLLAIWLFLATTVVVVPGVSPVFLLTIALGSTVLITVFHAPLKLMLLETPLFLGVDLLLVAILLTFSGAHRSPYSLYALSPLLAAAFFFQMRGALRATTAFTILYPLTLLIARLGYPITVELGQLSTQLVEAWLVTTLFGSLSRLLNQLQQTHQALAATHKNLTQQNSELAATYHQLEVIHELTLFLHASDSQSVQQRLLKAVTRELNFARAVVALVNPTLHRLEGWQAHPSPIDRSLATIPLPLTPENGLIAQAALDQQVRWCSEAETLVADEILEGWLETGNWLILPMVWQDQSVGVLVVMVETVGPVNMSDDRWAILTSLVSQAAVALGTIDRTRRLAVEQERNRIARDIHDTVAQSLFGIVFTLDACIKLLPAQARMVQQELIELRKVADQVRQQVRQSILDIWPSDLTQEQFKIDLGKYVAHCSPDHVFQIDFTIDGDFDGLSAVIRRSLYRVCQEALANAARHARVDSARVYLCVELEEVYLSVRDKGQGFDPKPVLARERDRERFGLRGMQERVQALGGTCDILSQVNHGTQVLVRIPINGRNGHD